MNLDMTGDQLIAVVPFSAEYGNNRLFDLGGELNRDGCLIPWATLVGDLRSRGFTVVTSDLVGAREPVAWLHLDCFAPPPLAAPKERTVLLLIEPRVVAPYWYGRFEKEPSLWAGVLTHEIALVARGAPFQYLCFPQSLPESAPAVERDLWLAMINSRKYPRSRQGSLYGARERVAAWFARRGEIDVFGPGWGSVDVRHPVSSWHNLAIRPSARGLVQNKSGVLRRAKFVLCFENMVSPGYRTEKLFDALASGAVPVYWGDPVLRDLVPESAFIDYSAIKNPRALRKKLLDLTDLDLHAMRSEGQAFLGGPTFAPYLPQGFASTVASVLLNVCR